MAVENENAEIVKARIDKRNYKRIVLRNSLQVLLISDPDTDKVSFLFDLRFFYPFHRETFISMLSPSDFDFVFVVEVCCFHERWCRLLL
jgi:hypothetical protein